MQDRIARFDGRGVQAASMGEMVAAPMFGIQRTEMVRPA